MDTVKELLKSKKYFLFDLDGTLVDLEDLNFSSFRNTVKKFLNTDMSYDDYLECFSGVGSRRGFENYMKKYSLDGDVKELQDDYRKSKQEQLDNNFENVVKIVRGSVEYLKYLKELGKKIALGTSNGKIFAIPIITKLGIRDCFDAVVTVDDVKKTKPDPEIYFKDLEMIGGNREEAVIFEDSPNGVQCAKNSGIDFVVVHLEGKNDEVVNKEKYVIESYDELM